MKTEGWSDEFEYFYLELPQADYLNDLDDIQIQDEHFNDYDSGPAGLSDEQVSKLADDALGASNSSKSRRHTKIVQVEQGLFSDQTTDN